MQNMPNDDFHSNCLQTILGSMPGVIYQLCQQTPDTPVWLAYLSGNCHPIFGVDADALSNENRLFLNYVHPAERELLQASLATSAQTLGCWLWTGRIVHPSSGITQWVQTTAQPCKGPHQEVRWHGLLMLVLPSAEQIKADQGGWGTPPLRAPFYELISTSRSVNTNWPNNTNHQRFNSAAGCPPNLSSPDGCAADGCAPDGCAPEAAIGQNWQQVHQVLELEHEVAERTSQLNQTIELLLDEVVERTHAEQNLRDREAFLHSIYNNVSQAIFVVDVDEEGEFRYADLNPACEETFGTNSATAKGRTPEEVLGDRIGLIWRQYYQQCLDQGQSLVYEDFTQLGTDPKWWLTQLTPLKKRDGTTYRIIGNTVDITHQKQVEKTLKKRDRLLQGVAIANRHLLTQHNISQSLQSALSALGVATGLEHIYVLERLESSEMHLSGEWGTSGTLVTEMMGGAKGESGETYGAGHTPSLDSSDAIALGRDAWYTNLALGDAIMGAVEFFPEPIRTYLSYYGVKAVLVEPLLIKQQVWGCIVFEDCSSGQEWPASERSILRTAAADIAGAIARHQIEVDLIESTQLLQLVLDNIPQAVFWKDLDSVYLGCNPTFAKAAGIGHFDDILGKTDFDLCWSEGEAELYRQNDQYVMESGTALYHVIEPQLQSDGKEILCDVNKIPLYDSDDNVVGILGTFEDITERQKAEDALRESEAKFRQQTHALQTTLDELQRTQSRLIQSEKMSSLGQLVAGVAHEINNPVNFIYGNLKYAHDYASSLLQLLEKYETYTVPAHPDLQAAIEDADLEFLKADFPKLLASIEVGAVRIRGIVASLRTFSRMDEAERKTVDIHDGIDSTLMLLQSRLRQNGSKVPDVHVEKQYGNLPLVDCFAGAINQVFMNLFTNALDAIDDAIAFHHSHGTPYHPQLSIHTTVQKKQATTACSIQEETPPDIPPSPATSNLVITVTDNALGIPDTAQPRLFDPFFTTKPVGQGTGMGLSISYQIITERHGGTLTCQSTIGEGTSFTIIIPLPPNNETLPISSNS